MSDLTKIILLIVWSAFALTCFWFAASMWLWSRKQRRDEKLQ
jgi:hypothetical protein